MTLIDTIPIYDTPLWLFILCAVTLAIVLLSFLASRDSDIAPIVAGISFIVFLTSFFLICSGVCNTYSHDEYVVTLEESVPSAFFRDYKLVKEFEYSDAIQVRKR